MVTEAITVVAFLAFAADPINFLLLGTFSYGPPNFRYRSRGSSATTKPFSGRPRGGNKRLDRYHRSLYGYTLETSDKLVAAVSSDRSIPSSRETIGEAIKTLSQQKRVRQIEGALDEPSSAEDLEYGASPLDF